MAISLKQPTRHVGVILPPPNPTVEPEYHAALPQGIVMHANRFPVQRGDLNERNAGYRASYADCVTSFRPIKMDAIIISCTGSNYLVGRDGDVETSRQMTELTGVPTMTSSAVILEALKTLKIRSLTLISPYPDWLTKQSADDWGGAGFALDEVIQLGIGADNIAFDLDDDDVVAEMEKVGPRAAGSAILMTGTGMPTIGAISKVQNRFNVPVLSSNLCGIWWLLRETGFNGGSEEFNRAAQPLLAMLD